MEREYRRSDEEHLHRRRCSAGRQDDAEGESEREGRNPRNRIAHRVPQTDGGGVRANRGRSSDVDRASTRTGGGREQRQHHKSPDLHNQRARSRRRGSAPVDADVKTTTKEAGECSRPRLFSEDEVIGILTHLQSKAPSLASFLSKPAPTEQGEMEEGWVKVVSKSSGKERAAASLSPRRINETPANSTCFLCGSFGHWKGKCRQGLKCYHCRKFGHKASECSERKGGGRWPETSPKRGSTVRESFRGTDASMGAERKKENRDERVEGEGEGRRKEMNVKLPNT